MKKLLTGILASTMILSTATMAAAQETFTEQSTQTLAYATAGTPRPAPSDTSDTADTGDSQYVEGQEGDWDGQADGSTAYLYKYLGSGGAVTVPSTFGGQPVVSVASEEYADITSLTFPDTLEECFIYANSIDTVYLPRSVEYGEISADTISTIYYEGTEEEFKKADVDVTVGRNSPEPTIIYNATMPSGTTTPSTPDSSAFPDWATDFVDFVSPEIMPDISTSNFNDASNRGLIAQSFYNMFANGTDLVPSHSFTDVGDFGTAVTWCHGAGIMSGTGETTFGTYGNVNREQFCLILKQMASVLEKDTASGDVSSLSDFSDSWSISDWAKEGVAWATANGLMAGSNGALNPQGDVTRLEVAIMLSAFTALETTQTPEDSSQGGSDVAGSTEQNYGAPTAHEVEGVEFLLKMIAWAGDEKDYSYSDSWELRLDEDGFNHQSTTPQWLLDEIDEGVTFVFSHSGWNMLTMETDFAKANPVVVGSAFNGSNWAAVLEDESAAWAEYITGFYTRSEFMAAGN